MLTVGVDRFPPDRYRHPQAVAGAAADPAFDLYGFDRIIEQRADRGGL